jgi:hypothetical protein
VPSYFFGAAEEKPFGPVCTCGHRASDHIPMNFERDRRCKRTTYPDGPCDCAEFRRAEESHA